MPDTQRTSQSSKMLESSSSIRSQADLVTVDAIGSGGEGHRSSNGETDRRDVEQPADARHRLALSVALGLAHSGEAEDEAEQAHREGEVAEDGDPGDRQADDAEHQRGDGHATAGPLDVNHRGGRRGKGSCVLMSLSVSVDGRGGSNCPTGERWLLGRAGVDLGCYPLPMSFTTYLQNDMTRDDDVLRTGCHRRTVGESRQTA